MLSHCWMMAAVLLLQPGLDTQNEAPAVPSRAEIVALIDQLVSPNSPPITGDEEERQAPDYRLPPGFDRAKQKQVHRASRKLKEIGPVAFPFLIERWDDKRYCRTTSDGLSGYCHNETVGQVCKAIMFDQLQPYGTWPLGYDDPRGKPKRPGYPSAFLHSPQKAKAWCERTQGVLLFEIQLKILDWVIATEANHPQNYTDSEREWLVEVRQELLKRNEPMRGRYILVDVEE